MADILERLKSALRESYAVDRQVGQGGMATVLLAEDRKHHRRVAIKVLRPELSATLGTERFLREIELAAKLQHPHIVPVYDSGIADGLLYYVMPFIDGESLRDLLQREGRLSLERAAEVVHDAASGLAYAHRQGVVHRDIKPENIMLSGGHAVVTDFGIARAIDASREEMGGLTGTGIAIGTPAYMSPEQATADQVDARSDQYALACVFYEMVSGKQPFSGPTMQAMLTQVLTGPRPRLATIISSTPPGLDATVQRALAQDPASRFPDILAFANAVTSESSGRAAATRESRRWKRLALILPVVVAVVVIVAMVLARPHPSVVSGAETIAVVPFNTSGAGVESLGEGMVDLVNGNLDGVGGIRTVESRLVLRAWQRRARNGTPTLDDAIAVARNVNAASVLTGSVVATGQTARLTAELYDLSGKQLARAQLDGPVDSVISLADALSLQVLHDIWRSKEPLPSARTSAITSTSLEAIRAYLDGEKWYRRGQWDSAQASYEHAVHADSTFAMAWYKLATTLGWEGQVGTAESMAAGQNAVTYSTALSPRVRSILIAYQMFQRGRPEAADSMRNYTALHPDDADGWYLLGEAQYHTRNYRPLSPAELIAPFDHVLALDSALTAAAIHPAEVAATEGDTSLLKRYRKVFQDAHADDEARGAGEALAAMRGSDTGLSTLLAPATTGLWIGLLYARMHAPDADGSSVLATFVHPPSGSDPSMMGQWYGLQGALNSGLGRQAVARQFADTAGTVYHQPDMSQFATLVPILGGFADTTMLRLFAHRLDSLVVAGTAPAISADFYRALVAIDLHEPARAASFIQSILSAPAGQGTGWLHGAAIGLDGLRMIQVGDTTRGAARADSGLRMIGGFSNPVAFGSLALRYALFLASQPATRADGIQRLRNGFTDRLELAPIIQFDLGRAYEAAGDRSKAAASYGQFLRLWNHADSNFQPRVRDAREALQRLTVEGSK
ncbi:MAG TPA: serine/threonine-protein kinase [Gemmatimonadales bacterium]|jgi:serine/threonine-protein kinase